MLRQINIDYAICQSLNSMGDGCRVVTIYDVACQWSRNFSRRVDDSKYLALPPDSVLIPAVGKWHLGAHVLECFPKYSLNFIKGIGQADGEIMETLWSITNKVAGMTRAMGKSHRAEVLDDNMYDSNWKKWTGIGELNPRKLWWQLIICLCSSSLEPKVQDSRIGFEDGRSSI